MTFKPLIVSLIVWSPSAPSNWATLHLIYSLCWSFYKSSHHMPKPPNASFYFQVSIIFSTIGTTQHFLSNATIPNPITSNMSTHPMQHSHLYYTKFIFLVGCLPPNIQFYYTRLFSFTIFSYVLNKNKFN